MKQLNLIKKEGRLIPRNIIFKSKDLVVELCEHKERLLEAFRLRYKAYLKTNNVPKNRQELLFDEFDFQNNTNTFLVLKDNIPIATVRSCVYSSHYNWQKTECQLYFPNDFEAQIGMNTPFIESNRFAVDPLFQGRQSLHARLLLFRIHALNALTHNCNLILTGVRTKHISFYKRFLGMELISEELQKCNWFNEEVALMAANYKSSMAIAIQKGLPSINQEDILSFSGFFPFTHSPSRKAS